jgi:hypothetical protein
MFTINPPIKAPSKAPADTVTTIKENIALLASKRELLWEGVIRLTRLHWTISHSYRIAYIVKY